MKKLVTKQVPEIRMVHKSELDDKDWIALMSKYSVKPDDFVLCMHGTETIFINKECDFADRIVPIVSDVMKNKLIDEHVDDLFNEVGAIAGKEVERLLIHIWYDWVCKREEADLYETANDILRQVKELHIEKHARKREDVIKTVFDIGYGTYDDNADCNYKQGSKNAFMFGYLCAMNDLMQKQ